MSDDPRSCTCPPGERPDPCERRYALTKCQAAACAPATVALDINSRDQYGQQGHAAAWRNAYYWGVRNPPTVEG